MKNAVKVKVRNAVAVVIALAAIAAMHALPVLAAGRWG